jgi:vanillate O-demethylase ferredoxin subunit
MWTLAPGARLSISTPGNHFELGRGRQEYLLLAGGIGITPIYTMALALVEAGARFRVLYAARRRQDLALADDLRARSAIGSTPSWTRTGSGSTLPARSAASCPKGSFTCAVRSGMLEAAKRAWAESGRPVDKLRFETFGNSGRFASEPFQVKIPRLGRVVEVPQNRTMLDALQEAGIDMIFDCRRGECGLCALDILETEGLVDHRDVFFSDDEKAANRKLCTCVSRVVGGSITVDTADRAA